mmetsp:Transcript_92341/g.149111  ORF Transcript_92341/g.149111 Transcript_92341/m.149111 type:complete len:113 (-) Transcript_92341:504-842(-)
MSGKDGIKTLLEAENKATESVAQARREKGARIKQARDEAYNEVKQYQAQLDTQLQTAVSQGMAQSDKSSKLASETENQLMEIRRNAEANRVNVVRQILAWVSTVDTTAPKAA